MQIQVEPHRLHSCIYITTPSSQCMEFAVSTKVTPHHAQICTEGMVKVLLIQRDGMASQPTQEAHNFLGEHALKSP